MFTISNEFFLILFYCTENIHSWLLVPGEAESKFQQHEKADLCLNLNSVVSWQGDLG